MPVYNYFKCTEGDFKYILKGVTDEKIAVKDIHIKAFERIREQIESRIKSNESQLEREKLHKALRLEEDRYILSNCFILLAVKHDEEIAEIVRSKGFIYREKHREADLKRLRGEIHNMSNKIAELTKKDSKEVKKVDVHDVITGLHKIYGINYDAHTLTVSQLISLYENGRNSKI